MLVWGSPSPAAPRQGAPLAGTLALGLGCPPGCWGGLCQQQVPLWARGAWPDRPCGVRLCVAPRQHPSSAGRAGCTPRSGQTRKGLAWPASLGDSALPRPRAAWHWAVPTCRAARSRHGTSPRPSLPAADWTVPLPPPASRPVTSARAGAGAHLGVPSRETINSLSRAPQPLAGPMPLCHECLRCETASPLSVQTGAAGALPARVLTPSRGHPGRPPAPHAPGDAAMILRTCAAPLAPPVPLRVGTHPARGFAHPGGPPAAARPPPWGSGEVTGRPPACPQLGTRARPSAPGAATDAGAALLPRARQGSDAETRPSPRGLAASPVPVRWWPCPGAGDHSGGDGGAPQLTALGTTSSSHGTDPAWCPKRLVAPRGLHEPCRGGGDLGHWAAPGAPIAAACAGVPRHAAQPLSATVGAEPGRCQDPGEGSTRCADRLPPPSGCARPHGLLVPRSGSLIPASCSPGGGFPGGAPLCKPRQRRLPGSRRPGAVITAQGMMSGLAATREDEREKAGPPPSRGSRGWGARLGRGEATGDAGGTWGTHPAASAPPGTFGCRCRQPLSGSRRGAGACPSPSSVPGERSSHGCGGGHATLPTINGSLWNKQEESCFANAAELSLHNAAAEQLAAELNKDGSVLGADGSR